MCAPERVWRWEWLARGLEKLLALEWAPELKQGQAQVLALELAQSRQLGLRAIY
jgi:hypothetical protein